MLGIAEKPLGIAEKSLGEPKSAQQRRKTTWQNSNVYIRGVLYLWATVCSFRKVALRGSLVIRVETITKIAEQWQENTFSFFVLSHAARLVPPVL